MAKDIDVDSDSKVPVFLQVGKHDVYIVVQLCLFDNVSVLI